MKNNSDYRMDHSINELHVTNHIHILNVQMNTEIIFNTIFIHLNVAVSMLIRYNAVPSLMPPNR